MLTKSTFIHGVFIVAVIMGVFSTCETAFALILEESFQPEKFDVTDMYETFPEDKRTFDALNLINTGKYDEAIRMIEKVLKGTSPGELPVEFQKELQLQINAKYSKMMGLEPPASLLDRATKIYN